MIVYYLQIQINLDFESKCQNNNEVPKVNDLPPKNKKKIKSINPLDLGIKNFLKKIQMIMALNIVKAQIIII